MSDLPSFSGLRAQPVDALEARVAALHRQNQLLKGAGLLLGGVIIGLVLRPASAPTPSPVSPSHPRAAAPAAAVAPRTPPVQAASTPPSAPQLTVLLSPPRKGVALALDGHLAGYTDKGRLVVKARPGHHELTLVSAGYVHNRISFEVRDAPVSLRMEAIELAHLHFDTTPRGARLQLDGPVQARSLGPVSFNALHPGRYRVEISRPGYESAVLVVRLPPGAQVREHASLSRIMPVAYQPFYRPIRHPRPAHNLDRAPGFVEVTPHHYTNRTPVPAPPRATPMDGEPLDIPPPGPSEPSVPGPEATHQ